MRWNDKVEEGKTYRQVCDFYYEEGDTLIDVQSEKFVENGVQYPPYVKKCYFKQTRCLYVSIFKHFNRVTLFKKKNRMLLRKGRDLKQNIY